MPINPYTRNLDSIVDVIVEVSPLAAPRPTFNQMLVIGQTADVIPVSERLRKYERGTYQADMLNDGFTDSSPEYLAAELYFGQSPPPDVLWVGIQGTTAIETFALRAKGHGYNIGDVLTITQSDASGGKVTVKTIEDDSAIATFSLGDAGLGYTHGDVLTIVQDGAVGGEVTVNTVAAETGAITALAVTLTAGGSGYSVDDDLETTVGSGGGSGATVNILTINDLSGAIASLETAITEEGTGYSAANGLATTVSPSGGTGATVDIDTVGETVLEALEACRLVNLNWYVCMSCQAVKSDHKAIALWAQSASPTTIYAFTTSDADVLAGTSGNVFDYCRDHNYSRIIGQYSTDSPYAIAAIMGYAMGQNTGLANSAYTLKFKQETGVATEDLRTAQIDTIEADNGNLYLSYGNYYSIFEQGVMCNGQFFDEIINLDMIINAIQLNLMDLYYGNPKVPQTDAGVTQEVHQVNLACEDSVLRGFLGPGRWTGVNILNLSYGDMLPKGYMVQAPAVADQDQSDREARKSVPLYVAIKSAGAVHSIVIGVYLNR